MTIDKQMLIDLWAEQANLEKEDAEQKFDDLIAEINSQTNDGKNFEWPGLGEFYQQDGKLQFEPTEELQTEVNYKYVGMQPIEVVEAYKDIPEHTEDEEQEKTAADESTSGEDKEHDLIPESPLSGDLSGLSSDKDETESTMDEQKYENMKKDSESPDEEDAGEKTEDKAPSETGREMDDESSGDDTSTGTDNDEAAEGETDKTTTNPIEEAIKADEEHSPFAYLENSLGPAPEELKEFEGEKVPGESDDELERNLETTPDETKKEEKVESGADVDAEADKDDSKAGKKTTEKAGKKEEQKPVSKSAGKESKKGTPKEKSKPKVKAGKRQSGRAKTKQKKKAVSPKPKKVKKSRDKKAPVATLLIIFVLIIAGGGYAWMYMNRSNEMNSGNEGGQPSVVMQNDEGSGGNTTSNNGGDEINDHSNSGADNEQPADESMKAPVPAADSGAQENPAEQNGTTEVGNNGTGQAESGGEHIYGLHGDVNSDANDGYTIVIFSLSNGANARNIKNQLEADGLRVLLKEMRLSGKDIWRVSLGQFKSREEARKAAKTLDEPYKSKHFIRSI